MIEFILYALLCVCVILLCLTFYVSHTICKIKRELKRMKFAEDEDV